MAGAGLSFALLATGFAYGYAAKTLDLWPSGELRRLASSGVARSTLVRLFPIDVEGGSAWRELPVSAPDAEETADIELQMARLEALGYA